MRISGWCFKEGTRVERVLFESGGRSEELDGYGRESGDVAAIFGAEWGRARFEFAVGGRATRGVLVFCFGDGSRVHESVDAWGVGARVLPLRHQLERGWYRGLFRVRGADAVAGVSLGMAGERALGAGEYATRRDGEDLLVEIELAALADWTADGLCLELRDGAGELLRVSSMQMLAVSNDPAHRISGAFLAWLRGRPERLRVVELGSRARSGVVRRRQFGEQHEYLGVDIAAGENVDLVCDAHELSLHLPRGSVDAVAGYSVFEHLAMPWKVAVELNRVLKVGGRCLFHTHQTWPLHDAPFDFWRYSAESWGALFNRATGFRVLEAACGEAARIVPEVQKSGLSDFGGAHGYLCSAALVEKVGETALDWEVPVEEVYRGRYPA